MAKRKATIEPDASQLEQFIGKAYDQDILGVLEEYIRIPNQSPAFDPHWSTNGLQEKVMALYTGWIDRQNVPGLSYKVLEEKGRTPLLFVTVEATTRGDEVDTLLCYGHVDKQPPMSEGWEADLGPYKPVMRDEKLYGRGGADDGYACFAAVTAIKALKKQGVPHARIVMVIEASEESGSPDLEHYIRQLREEIGTPSLVVCLDSGCGNYEQFWITTSLRGLAAVDVRASVLKEGVHSGHGSGIVGSSFRALRQVFDQLEDPVTGKVLVPELWQEIPENRIAEAKICAEALGTEIYDEYAWVEGAGPVSKDLVELLLNRTWRPTVSYTGAGGLPAMEHAGNVLRPFTDMHLSLRLPPGIDADAAVEALKKRIEAAKPDFCDVQVRGSQAASGWEAPKTATWLHNALEAASQSVFEKPYVCLGEGGSIPFMGLLGDLFPKAQFAITGVLGPKSNAHGPNEFLHVPFVKKITACVAVIMAQHGQRSEEGEFRG